MEHIATLEHDPGLKRKDVLTHATAQVKPEGIILTEISQTQKDDYCAIHYVRSLE